MTCSLVINSPGIQEHGRRTFNKYTFLTLSSTRTILYNNRFMVVADDECESNPRGGSHTHCPRGFPRV